MKLDAKDHLLMQLLKHDARVTNRKLARLVGLSPSACLARVRRLEAHGYIVAYRTILARSGFGSLLEGWAGVSLVDPNASATQAFLHLVTGTPEIIEAHRIAGQYDYALRFCSGDLGSWSQFREQLATIGCEAKAMISILVEPLK